MARIGLDYVGIDNQAAGRMAGLLMSGMQRREGSVVVMCHSQVYAVHRERVRGFSDYLARAETRHLAFRQAVFTRDDDDEAAAGLLEALRAYPDLAGIYSAGGNTPALCDCLRHQGKGRSICFVGHELDNHSAAALKDGTMQAVLDQAPETQARRSLDLVLHRLGLVATPVDRTPIRFITITAENL